MKINWGWVLTGVLALFTVQDTAIGPKWLLHGAQYSMEVLDRKHDDVVLAHIDSKFSHTDSVADRALIVGMQNKTALDNIAKIPIIAQGLAVQNVRRLKDSILQVQRDMNLYAGHKNESSCCLDNY